MSNRTHREISDRVIARAEAYLGFTSRANRVNGFGAGVRQNGKPWDGSFLETVMFEAKLSGVPAFTSTASALAFFMRTNRIVSKPQRGDIVFFAFSSDDDGFGQPHVGLVTHTADFKSVGRFRTVEAMTSTGSSQGPQEENGVYYRDRYDSDVLAFARPRYAEPLTVPSVPENSVSRARLTPSNFERGKMSNPTWLVQYALHDVLGTSNFNRGHYDKKTVSAVHAYQRHIGLVQTTGNLDELTLTALAKEARFKYFHVKVFTP